MGQRAAALLVDEEGVHPEVKQLAITNVARPENRIILEILETEMLYRFD